MTSYSAMNLFWFDSKRLMPNSSKTVKLRQQLTMEQFIVLKCRRILIVLKNRCLFLTFLEQKYR